MSWTCEQIELRTSDYLDRSMQPLELRDFAEHLAGCQRCSQMISSVTRLLAGIARLEELEPPPQLVDSILDRTIGPRTKTRGWPALLGWLAPIWEPRFAMGLVTVAITAALVFQAFGIDPRGITFADLHPAKLYRAADREVHLLYARSVRFVNELRVVYEIQTRLQPEPEPGAAPDAEPSATPSEQPGKQRERNRADELGPQPQLLALAVPGILFRSNP